MRKEEPIGFQYKNLGSMATVGRHLAVVDLPFWKFQGAFAWYVWMFVHLMVNAIGESDQLDRKVRRLAVTEQSPLQTGPPPK